MIECHIITKKVGSDFTFSVNPKNRKNEHYIISRLEIITL